MPDNSVVFRTNEGMDVGAGPVMGDPTGPIFGVESDEKTLHVIERCPVKSK